MNKDAIDLTPLPVPSDFKSDMDAPVAFDAGTKVTLDCPDADAAEWLSRHFTDWFGVHSPSIVLQIQPKAKSQKLEAPSSKLQAPSSNPESYSIAADAANGVRIEANSLAGVRWAAYTLRQLAIAKRGTLTADGYLLPSLAISDAPLLQFRGIHLCWFPEVRPQQIERAIRLAALLKFNYAVIEPWGMFESERHPWWHWPNPTLTKAEIARLVAIGRDLGITLIPQLNAFGHGSSSRGCSLKHCVLDFHPEYEPLFEPGGWNWCLTNQETQRVLRELVAEMHEAFGNPPFFHLGCDEAQPPSCPECRKVPYGELVCRHISGLADFVKSRGARPMIWHDMLLERGDPRWSGFVAMGSDGTATLADTLPRDVIICDWQYSYGDMGEVRRDWPTMEYFARKGFPVCGCPWLNFNAMRPMADCIARIGGFGLLETTWHHLRADHWSRMFESASAAAWGTPAPPSPPMFNTPFANALRLVGRDMGVTDYLDTGILNHQIPPSWFVD